MDAVWSGLLKPCDVEAARCNLEALSLSDDRVYWPGIRKNSGTVLPRTELLGAYRSGDQFAGENASQSLAGARHQQEIAANPSY